MWLDDLISPEDNIDPISGSDFVYLEIPFSNHTNVLDLEIPPEDEQQVPTIPEQRGDATGKSSLVYEPVR